MLRTKQHSACQQHSWLEKLSRLVVSAVLKGRKRQLALYIRDVKLNCLRSVPTALKSPRPH